MVREPGVQPRGIPVTNMISEHFTLVLEEGLRRARVTIPVAVLEVEGTMFGGRQRVRRNGGRGIVYSTDGPATPLEAFDTLGPRMAYPENGELYVGAAFPDGRASGLIVRETGVSLTVEGEGPERTVFIVSHDPQLATSDNSNMVVDVSGIPDEGDMRALAALERAGEDVILRRQRKEDGGKIEGLLSSYKII